MEGRVVFKYLPLLLRIFFHYARTFRRERVVRLSFRVTNGWIARTPQVYFEPTAVGLLRYIHNTISCLPTLTISLFPAALPLGAACPTLRSPNASELLGGPCRHPPAQPTTFQLPAAPAELPPTRLYHFHNWLPLLNTSKLYPNSYNILFKFLFEREELILAIKMTYRLNLKYDSPFRAHKEAQGLEPQTWIL